MDQPTYARWSPRLMLQQTGRPANPFVPISSGFVAQISPELRRRLAGEPAREGGRWTPRFWSGLGYYATGEGANLTQRGNGPGYRRRNHGARAAGATRRRLACDSVAGVGPLTTAAGGPGGGDFMSSPSTGGTFRRPAVTAKGQFSACFFLLVGLLSPCATPGQPAVYGTRARPAAAGADGPRALRSGAGRISRQGAGWSWARWSGATRVADLRTICTRAAAPWRAPAEGARGPPPAGS